MSEINEAPMGSQAQAKAFLKSLKEDGPAPVSLEDAAPQDVDDATPFDEAPPQEKPVEEKKGPGRPKKNAEPEMQKSQAPVTENKNGKNEDIDDQSYSLMQEYEGIDQEDNKKGVNGKAEEKQSPKAAPTQKESEYDVMISDPLVKAIVEWRKAGGSNPKEFVDQLGLNSQPLTMRDHFEQDAISLGLEGDDLEEAVEEAMSNYESLPIIERRKKELEYKSKESQSMEERLKSFTVGQGEHQESIKKIQDEASSTLLKSVGDLKGTKFKGMLIDEPMAQTIEKDAPMFTPAIFDEQGNLVGYDVERGITAAIAVNYLPKLLRETYMLGKTAAGTQFAKERHRPNADPNGGSASAAIGKEEALDSALTNFAKKFSGSRS
jgi:hypothetical protein